MLAGAACSSSASTTTSTPERQSDINIQAAIDAVLESTSGPQEEALSDRTVSTNEYKLAVDEAFNCFTQEVARLNIPDDVDISFNAPSPSPSGLIDWSFRIGSFNEATADEVAVTLEATDASCRETFSNDVEEIYRLLSIPVAGDRADLTEKLRDCVEEANGKLPEDFDVVDIGSLDEETASLVARCSVVAPGLFELPRGG